MAAISESRIPHDKEPGTPFEDVSCHLWDYRRWGAMFHVKTRVQVLGLCRNGIFFHTVGFLDFCVSPISSDRATRMNWTISSPVSIPRWIFNIDMISCEHLFRPISKWFTEYSSIFMPRNIVVYSHAISPNAIPDAVAVARKLHSHGDPVDGLCRLLLCCPVRRTRGCGCWEEPRERGTNWFSVGVGFPWFSIKVFG